MSKRELLSEGLANVRESMGDFGGVVHRAPTPGPRPIPAHLQGVVRSKDVSQIDLSRIVRDPSQPREEFDDEALDLLARSLRTRGQLQPIRVRWSEEQGAYMIVVGERRWRAAQRAGLSNLSCVIVECTMPADEILAIQMIENAVREDLKPIEQANAYRRLVDVKGWSVRQLAAELSVHHAQVVRSLALLDLPSDVRSRVEQGELSPATAYELGKIEDPVAQAEVTRRVVAEKLNRAETVEAVRKAAGAGSSRSSKGRGARPRPVTSRVFKTAPGIKITAERSKGISPLDLVAALEEATAKARLEASPAEERAAI